MSFIGGRAFDVKKHKTFICGKTLQLRTSAFDRLSAIKHNPDSLR